MEVVGRKEVRGISTESHGGMPRGWLQPAWEEGGFGEGRRQDAGQEEEGGRGR